jgi:hypothetical protein
MREATAVRSCSDIPSCELFPKFALSGALKIWHACYCHGRFTHCARYRRAAEGRPVPMSLLPDGRVIDLRVRPRADGAGRRIAY